jgi:RNA polymerase sigma-70 factor (ECF subfamily)
MRLGEANGLRGPMSDLSERDDQLVGRLLGGEEAAFVEVYRRFQGSVYRFALGMLGSKETAEDVTQETFMVLLREGERFDPKKGALGSYLRGIARFLVYKRFRREGRYVALAEDFDETTPSDEGSPDERLSRIEDVQAVRTAVAALPAHYREVIVLAELEGLSYAAVAETLRLPVGTVRSRLFRAREILARGLAPQERTTPSWSGAFLGLTS